MGLSLRELKEQLMAKEGYTITPNHNNLNDLKVLVDDMMNERSESPPSSGSGNYSGTTCSGHVQHSEYKLSLGDINDLDIKGCSCHTVRDTTAYCGSRTYSCSCNSNTPACTCNSRTAPPCDCQNRTSAGRCSNNYVSCSAMLCGYNSPTCTCQGFRFSQDGGAGCYDRVAAPVCDCNTRTPDPCNCRSRTSSCGSRSTTSCTCNGRCACNAEKRFG